MVVNDINRAAAETALHETLRPGRHRPPSPTSLRSLTGGGLRPDAAVPHPVRGR